MLRAIARILQEAGFGSLGVNIFIHFMPFDVDRGILILPRLSGDVIDNEIRGLRNGGFQLIVREGGYDDTLIKSLMPVLTMVDKQAQGFDFRISLPITDPLVYPATDGNNIEYSVNFNTVYAKI